MKVLVPMILAQMLLLSIPGRVVAQTGSAEHIQLTGWEAHAELLKGNRRFLSGQSLNPGRESKHLRSLVSSQHPHSIIVSCSDSQGPPEMVFDQGPGDLFVVRSAAAGVDSAGLASIEYAIESLDIRLLVVMGHEACGAVAAVLNDSHADSPVLGKFLSDIRQNLSERGESASKTQLKAVRAQVSAVVQDILNQSSVVRDAVRNKGLLVAQAVYREKSSRVDFLEVGQPTVVDERVKFSQPKSSGFQSESEDKRPAFGY